MNKRIEKLQKCGREILFCNLEMTLCEVIVDVNNGLCPWFLTQGS